MTDAPAVPSPTAGTEGAMLVEWLDRIPEAAPREYLRLTLSEAGDDARELVAEAWGQRPAELLRAWLLP